jgi:hypothetical protein
MKRIEVKLAVPVVAPLLDVIRALGETPSVPAPGVTVPPDADSDLRGAWIGELAAAETAEVRALLALFDEVFFREGIVAFDAENASVILRACSVLRLRLRESYLRAWGDDALESGDVEAGPFEPGGHKAMACFLFLATVQELILQHLGDNILAN